MKKLFNERVDSSVEFLHDYFNSQATGDYVTKEELKETLVTVLEMIKQGDK